MTFKKGFTLVEMMVVMIILGLVASTVLSRTAWKKNETKEFHQEFKNLSQEIFLKARLKNTVYRMVFKILDESREEGPAVLVYAESRVGSQFEKDSDKLLKELKFPKTIKYEDFLSNLEENKEDPKAEEVGEGEKKEEKSFFYRYVYFFPQGYVSPSAVLVEQKNEAWTFTFESLTGKAKVIKGHVDLEKIAEKESL